MRRNSSSSRFPRGNPGEVRPNPKVQSNRLGAFRRRAYHSSLYETNRLFAHIRIFRLHLRRHFCGPDHHAINFAIDIDIDPAQRDAGKLSPED